ncbi:putative HD superfamily hydrolase involved in NAD metabolism [Evansella vedderi]|uniref:bis(5'-nucleosyl)-tetraphosphatase (symmetrical) n=1 Tax=Evansella vedderi TaxID=38282 RepID=A0ABT9ZSX0_9BACI|nr:bis(5'-nucleosyl)-tetraphosphatase (symmetrical) YqeK [Evansella vedderi]MDQ0254325.1 putative HD superfamily hydrolase involved in NAD metabolism [Evansella vedderi]
MNEEQAFAAVKKSLKKRRYEHTIRVTEETERLAQRFNVNVEKARLAAILHDYAKYRPVEEMRKTIKEENLPGNLLNFGDEILHAFVGAFYVAKELNVDDLGVLDAIRYHTTGRANMSNLEKVVFLADYIEPGRSFAGIDEVRLAAETNLDKACFLALRNTINFLVLKQQPVYPETFEAYNDYAIVFKGRS